jgi:glycosyltransferase involved in cell wall biosynthesis
MPTFEQGISVVICSYNGKSRLAATLQSIFALIDPKDWPWELIVIDNASTDGTGDFCRQQIAAASFRHSARVIEEPRQGCNHARLKGLYSCTYKWLLFCDDDNHLNEDYLLRAVELLEQYQDAGVLGGCGRPLFESSAPSWFDQYHHSFGVGPQFAKEGLIPKNCGVKLYSAGSFFNREPLLQFFESGFQPIMIGRHGKNLTSGEDTEWCMMTQLLGYELYYSGKLIFQHYMPDSRMNWEYYLRLKKGISSGLARLSAYLPFFRKVNPRLIDFLMIYYKESFFYRLLAWKAWFSKSRTRSTQLGKMILSEKAKAYSEDFKIAKAHFLQLQKMVKRLNAN